MKTTQASGSPPTLTLPHRGEGIRRARAKPSAYGAKPPEPGVSPTGETLSPVDKLSNRISAKTLPPRRPLPRLNTLRAFEAAARHLGLSLAVNELHVTPAAISHRVRLLEDHIGLSVFERNGRGLVLTDAGATRFVSIGSRCWSRRRMNPCRGEAIP